MGEGAKESPLRRAWRTLCWLIGALLVLLGLGAIGTAIAHGHLAKGETTGGSIVSILFIWLLAGLFLGLSRRGRAHGRLGLLLARLSGWLPFRRYRLVGGSTASADTPPHPEAIRAVLTALGRDPATSSHARALIKRSERQYSRYQRNPAAWKRRQRRQRLIGTVVLVVGLPAMALLFTVGAIERHAAWARSSYTQAHGILAPGTVRRTINSQSCGRHSCTNTSTITLALSAPVDGTTTTYVHTPTTFDPPTGWPLEVLVDPHQPAYGEIPGQQAHSMLDWILWSVIAIIIDISTVLVLVGLVQSRRRQRRRLRRAPATT